MKTERHRRITPLNAVLADMDIKKDEQGNLHVFSIAFVTKKGEYIYLPKAVRSGLTQNMKKNDLKGVVKIDENNKPTGHPYPVYIHSICLYRSKNYSYNAKY